MILMICFILFFFFLFFPTAEMLYIFCFLLEVLGTQKNDDVCIIFPSKQLMQLQISTEQKLGG